MELTKQPGGTSDYAYWCSQNIFQERKAWDVEPDIRPDFAEYLAKAGGWYFGQTLVENTPEGTHNIFQGELFTYIQDGDKRLILRERVERDPAFREYRSRAMIATYDASGKLIKDHQKGSDLPQPKQM